MVVTSLLTAVAVKMGMALIRMKMIVHVDLGVECYPNRPRAYAEEQESHHELRPGRPCAHVHESPQPEAESSHDQDGRTVAEAPKGPALPGLRWILDRQWSQSGQMIGTRKDMQAARGEPGENGDHGEGTLLAGNFQSISCHQNAMRRLLPSRIIALGLIVGACGLPVGQTGNSVGPDDPLLQLRSEGGFVPLEWALGHGPTYTLLGDGRLILEGPVIEIYPGPLLPNYQIGKISSGDLKTILDIVAEMGLPSIVDEYDDSAANHVADANTEVVTLWDAAGRHVYSVYALGIDHYPSNSKKAAFVKLLAAVDQAASKADTKPYQGEKVRVLAGVAMGAPDSQFEDVRPWPLEDNLEQWTELQNGWLCTIVGPEKLALFQDATQVTEWLHPDPMMDAPTYRLLVRPLLPGEQDCPV